MPCVQFMCCFAISVHQSSQTKHRSVADSHDCHTHPSPLLAADCLATVSAWMRWTEGATHAQIVPCAPPLPLLSSGLMPSTANRFPSFSQPAPVSCAPILAPAAHLPRSVHILPPARALPYSLAHTHKRRKLNFLPVSVTPSRSLSAFSQDTGAAERISDLPISPT